MSQEVIILMLLLLVQLFLIQRVIKNRLALQISYISLSLGFFLLTFSALTIYFFGDKALSSGLFLGLFGSLAISYGFYGDSLVSRKKCSRCNSHYFEQYGDCVICNEGVCKKCSQSVSANTYNEWEIIPAGRCCNSHLDSYNDIVKQKREIVDASDFVKLFSINHNGNLSAPNLGKRLETKFHESKEAADRELRILAASFSSDIVQRVDYIKQSAQAGNYIYKVWKATGYI